MNNHCFREGLCKTVLPVIVLFTCLLASCVTPPGIYTFVLEDGIQQDFVRPTEFKDGNIDASIDFTVHSKNGSIVNPVTVNFSLNGSIFGKSKGEGVRVLIACDGTEYEVQEVTTLYKSRNPETLRRTGKIEEESFKNIVYASDIKVIFVSEDGSRAEFTSARLRNSLNALQDVI